MKTNSTIISLERNNLYGGVSLFAPFFKTKFYICRLHKSKIKKRGSYNKVNNLSKIILKKKIINLIIEKFH